MKTKNQNFTEFKSKFWKQIQNELATTIMYLLTLFVMMYAVISVSFSQPQTLTSPEDLYSATTSSLKVFAVSETNGTNTSGADCYINHSTNVVDADFTNFATMGLKVSKPGTYQYQKLKFQDIVAVGSLVTLIVEDNFKKLLDKQMFASIQISTFLNGISNDDAAWGNNFDIHLLEGSRSKYRMAFCTDFDFNEIRITLISGIPNTIKEIRIYSVFNSFSNTQNGVRWNYFNATNKNDNIVLEWATDREIDNSYFSVEKSLDDLNYETIGFKAPITGSYNALREYSFIDKPISENPYYYRIKQTNSDGKSEYSEVILVNQNEFLDCNTINSKPIMNNHQTKFKEN